MIFIVQLCFFITPLHKGYYLGYIKLEKYNKCNIHTFKLCVCAVYKQYFN